MFLPTSPRLGVGRSRPRSQCYSTALSLGFSGTSDVLLTCGVPGLDAAALAVLNSKVRARPPAIDDCL